MRQGGVQPAPQAHAPALLHHAPPTPGRSTPPEFLTPGRQLSLPTQISGFSPQTLPPGVLYHSPTPSHDQQMTALRPSQLKQLVGHSEPPLSQADQACLMHLGTQSMSQECRVGSGQVPAQLPTQLPVPVARPRDPRTLSPPVISQASPACSGQFPAQPPANSPAKSRDPRRPANQCSAVATSVSHPVEGLRHSPQISEPMTPTSPTQSALFASIMMLDSPDAMSGVLNTGDALMNSEDALMTGPSPARWHSPEPQAPFQQTQFSDTSLPALEQLLGNHRDFEFAAECEELSACMVDPESFLLNEAIQAAGQHSQQAQRDSVSPPEAQRDSVSPPLVPLSSETSPGISQAQSLARRAPSSSLESQNFPSPKGQTIFLLQQLPGCDSNESFSAARKGGRNSLRRKWPEVQPYTFCRWQLLVME